MTSIYAELEEMMMNKRTALGMLQALDGRKITFQYKIIMFCIERAERILKKDPLMKGEKEEYADVYEAKMIYEDWLEDCKKNDLFKDCFPYLRIKTVEMCRDIAKHLRVWDDEFFKAYKNANGEYEGLRYIKVPGKDITWDIERDRRLKEIIHKMKNENIPLFRNKGCLQLPSNEHIQCVALAYDPSLQFDD